MKFLIFAFSLLVLAGCSGNVEKQHKDNLVPFQTKSQLFTIDPDSVAVFKGQQGTRVEIKSNSFEKKDGFPPDTLVTIALKEVYSKSQMVLNGLATMSNGQLLETGGMVYLNAMAGQDSLYLVKQVRISMPNKLTLSGGKYFKGTIAGNKVNWTLNEYGIDTTLTTRRVITLSYGADSAFVFKTRIIGNDTITFRDSGRSLNEDVAMDQPMAVDVPNEYLFSINKLGWINCDKFLDISDPISLTINHNEDVYPTTYLIYENLNSISYINFYNGEANSKPLPKGERATILAFFMENDGYKMYNNRIKLGATTNVTMKFKTVSFAQLKEEIEKL